MIQIVWFLVAGVGAVPRPYSKTCPQVACVSHLPAGVCLMSGDGTADVQVSPCQLWETCPVPNGLETAQTLKCYDSRLDKYGTTAKTYEEYLEAKLRWIQYTTNEAIDFKIRQENEGCYNRWDRCNPERGLVCQCEGFCRCVQGAKAGDVCSIYQTSSVPMCAHGFGCYKGICQPWFSLDGQETVMDAWLCKSMQVDAVGHTCVVSDYHSDQSLQTPCGSDADCIGVHGSSGSCLCGVNGLAYCALLNNDSVYLSYQAAILALDVPNMAYWAYVSDFWIHLQRHLGNAGDYTFLNPLACIGSLWPITVQYDSQVQTDLLQVVQSAAQLLVVGVALLLSFN